MSTSARPTRRPRARSATARLAATVDLPTPPLPLDTAMMRATPSMRGWRETGTTGSGMAVSVSVIVVVPVDVRFDPGDPRRQLLEGFRRGARRIGDDDRRPRVAALADRSRQRHAAEHRNAEAVGYTRRAAVSEDVGGRPAARA